MPRKHLELLATATELLTQANLAIPVIFGTVAAISAIIKGITGSGPSLLEIADLIESQLDTNDRQIQAEIDRMKAALG